MTEERKSFTASQMRDLVFMQGGKCPECGEPINLAKGDRVEVDHRIPLALGGSNGWENMQALHFPCHFKKTARDRRQIAKAKRVAAKFTGQAKPSRHKIAGGKHDHFKRKVGGGVVPRHTGERMGR